MANKTKLNLKNDIIFKAFFSGKDGEEFLIDLLTSLLEIKITKLTVREEVNLLQLSTKEKGGRLDLQATINDGTIVNIELQIRDEHNIWKRTLLYAAKTLSRETEIGTKYTEVKKLIIISILGYNMFKHNDYISKTVVALDKHRDYEVMDDIKWYFVELPKFREQRPDMSKKINQWLYLIDDEDKEMIQMAETKSKTLKKAREKINYLTGDDAVRRLAELREMWAMDYNSGIDYAKKEGEKSQKIAIAKKLLERGTTIKEISEITDLEVEEIEKIKELVDKK